MTFLPIVARELRVTARRRSTYWTRMLLAVAAIIIALFVYQDSYREPSHKLGSELFSVISICAFIYCICVGIRATSDCISEEKREGTLGLLFLTDLKGYDVVAGKLVATSLNSFYGLIAIFPVLAIPLLMGGITNGEFWRMSLVLANTFLFSLAVGMFVSSVSKFPRKATAATVLLLVFFALGLPLVENTVRFFITSPHLNAVCKTFTPETSFSLVSDVDYAKKAAEFWWSIGGIHSLCWLLLGLASVIVPRSWQDHPSGSRLQGWRDTWHRWNYGDEGERREFRKKLLDINAVFWLAGRARLKPGYVWTALGGIACLWSWGAIEEGRSWLASFTYFLTAIILNTTLKFWVASEAGWRFAEDRKIGALELLLSTPMSIADIIQGQVLALKRQFLGPIAAALLVEFIFLLASLRADKSSGDDVYVTVAFMLAIMGLLVADVLALSVVGMWIGLTAKNPNRVTGMTVRRILVLPWGVIVILFLSGALLSFAGRGYEPGWKLFWSLYFFSGIGTDVFFGVNAWRRLHLEFREVAVKRFSTEPSWFGRLLGRK